MDFRLGFELLSEDVQSYQENSASLKSGRLENVSLTTTQGVLYFDAIAPGDTFAVSFRVRAKYPIRARSFASRVYEYYDPEVRSLARPAQLKVRKTVTMSLTSWLAKLRLRALSVGWTGLCPILCPPRARRHLYRLLRHQKELLRKRLISRNLS